MNSGTNSNPSKDMTADPKRGFTFSELAGFLLPSGLGLFLFMIPLNYGGNVTIFVAMVAKFLEQTLSAVLPGLAGLMIGISALASLLTYFLKPGWVIHHQFLNSLLNVGPRWTLVRFLGAVFAGMVLSGSGIEIVYSEKTGAFVLLELLPILFCVFLIAGFFLPLLLNFGLIEFFGVLLSKFMRPVFTLPGRSSIDCLASWVGDGTIGVLLTNKQYEDGYYTKREAAVIGTTFSLVSITFAMVILTQVKLEHLFPQFYLTVFLAGFIAAIICPRIYPLSKIPDVYIDGSPFQDDRDEVPLSSGRWSYALRLGVTRAGQNRDLIKTLREGVQNVLDMWLGVLPTVLCFGTIALALAEFTSMFQYLGVPFQPLLELLRVPEAELVAPTIMLGFADMFLPSVMVSSVESEFTRFVVACLSVSQLIYMSEVGSLLLGSKIPVQFKEIFLIYLIRTLITLPVIVACAHLIF